MRRAHHDKMELPTLDTCLNCGAVKLRHRVCGACGFYRGRKLIAVKGDAGLGDAGLDGAGLAAAEDASPAGSEA